MTVSLQYPWDLPPAPGADSVPPDPDASQIKPKPRGRRPIVATQAAKLAQPVASGWLYHHLTISGPADGVASFAAAARGSGVVPWRLDFAALEEDVFNRAVAQPTNRRSLTVEGCHILARQFRDRVEAHQARAAAQVGQSMACPFDLHRLRPVPDVILQLGPADPAALAWLEQHWGVTDRLRQVTVRPNATAGRRLPRGSDVISYGFFTPGETPHAAITHIAAQWPALRFALMPRPAG